MNKIYGLVRIRNEEQIIQDTLNHLSSFCNGGIIVYDDCSEDNSRNICKAHSSVIKIIQGEYWNPVRENAEYENRAALIAEVKKHADDKDWLVYLDADERIEFDWLLLEKLSNDVIGIRMKLFDFYITKDDKNENYNSRKFIGPEYRKILIAFRNLPHLEYSQPDQREVKLNAEGIILDEGYIKHYGKAISIDNWEKRCNYYAKYFPAYSKKWESRKGKAVHNEISDFGFRLIQWHEKELRGFLMYPPTQQTKIKNKESIMNKPLKVLLTNHHLFDYTGSEVYTLTLAKYLNLNGCIVKVYSPYIDDKFTREFHKINIQVYSNLEELNNIQFDIAHVHHNITAIEVRKHFPKLPIVFLSHGVLPFLEQPPLAIENIIFFAVSEEVKENLLRQGCSDDNVRLFTNIIDDEVFYPVKPINHLPQKALILSGRLDEEKEAIIREACNEMNIQSVFVGGRFGSVLYSEVRDLINEADIVFSLGRGAIEAMLCGRIPIIFDYQGADGMVTPENFHEIRKNNFSGRRFAHTYDKERLINEIKKYNGENGERLLSLAKENYSADTKVKWLIGQYRVIIGKNIFENPIDENREIDFLYNVISESRNYSYSFGYKHADMKYLDQSNELLIFAEQLIEKGDTDNAEKLLMFILKYDSKNLDAVNNLAVIHIINKNYSEALNKIQFVLNQNPYDEVALSNLKYINQEVENLNNLNSSSITEKISCPFCGSTIAKNVRNIADIVQCLNCDTVYLRTRLKKEEMEKLYQSYADGDSHMKLPQNRDEINMSPLRRDYFLKEILNFTKPEGNILDIGCGWGAFLDNARNYGFKPRGIELTKKCVNFAKDNLDIFVTSNQFNDTEFANESFTVISMNHVFEHLPYPKDSLYKIFTLLKPGGIFAGIVPNFNSYCSKQLKDNWYWLDPNYHYVHYTPSTLKKHFSDHGFKILRLYTTTGDYGKANVINIICNYEHVDESTAEKILESKNANNEGEEIRFIIQKEN